MLFFAASVVVYPIADNLKEIGAGSDQDDAIIEGARAILATGTPYTATTYFGNPISPGPGWIILWMPLVLCDLYLLINPISFFVLTIVILKITKSWRVINELFILSASSLIFWELLAVGSDLIALSALLASSFILLWHYQHKLHILIFLAILTGLIATSRIVFIFVPPLFSFLILQKGKFHALIFATLSVFVCIGLHFYFHNLTPFYPPMHLLSKAGVYPLWFKISAIISCCFVGIWIIIVKAKNLFDALIRVWAVLFFPLFFTSMGDLIISRNWNFSFWEGANYLIPPLFIALTFRALNLQYLKK